MNRQRSFLVWTLALAILAGWISTGHAQLTWDWSYTSQTIPPEYAGALSSFSGGGTMVTSSTEVNGAYSILSISGTWSITEAASPFTTGTTTITGLLPIGGVDELLTADGQVDNFGIGFGVPGDYFIFIRNHGGSYDLATEVSETVARGTNDDTGNLSSDPVLNFSATLVATPEPSALMMGLGACVLFVGLRRLRKNA